jgi:hypothetical protein
MKAHPSLKPALWGAVAGAVAISVIGFSTMGWTLGSTAERMAADRTESAIVSVLAPICVEKFQQQANSAAKLIEFKKAASWDQRALIEKGGWATPSGTETITQRSPTPAQKKLAGFPEATQLALAEWVVEARQEQSDAPPMIGRSDHLPNPSPGVI